MNFGLGVALGILLVMHKHFHDVLLLVDCLVEYGHGSHSMISSFGCFILWSFLHELVEVHFFIAARIDIISVFLLGQLEMSHLQMIQIK
jgi:hypothetical protein